MNHLTRTLLLNKINLIVDKLLNLEEPEDMNQDKATSLDAHKKGIIARDFGIKEWDWPQGVGLYGLTHLQNYHLDNRFDNFLDQWTKDNLSIGLPSRNINTSAPYLSLMSLAERQNQDDYRQLCLTHAQWLLDSLPRTEEGGFQHVTSAIGDRHGISLNNGEMWIDTLFMAVLFLNKMGHLHHRQDFISEATKQVLIHIKYLYDKSSGLFYHGWTFNQRNNFGGIFWCRGNSWFTFGILEYLEDSLYTLDLGVRDFIVDTFKSQAKALKLLQAPSGLWYTVLNDSTSYEEVSGSAAISKGLLKAVSMGLLDDSYRICALKAIEAICDNIDTDGTVLNVSAGTGMGYDAEHYKNILKMPMAYGQSLTLVALCEALNTLAS